MAMTAAGLETKMVEELEAVNITIYDQTVLAPLAAAIVGYIQSNAELLGAVTTPNTTVGTITTAGSSVL